MQTGTSRVNDYGDFIIEIDKLVQADREELVILAGNVYQAPVLPKLHTAHVNAAPATTSLGGMVREQRPQPVIWQNSTSNVQGGDISPNSAGLASNDSRQVRLFKTRFCSYGLECPYLAKGKCLYAHNKDEIRLRPPPPSRLRISLKDSREESSAAVGTDQSPAASNESVWTLPESPVHSIENDPAKDITWPRLENVASLFECLRPAANSSTMPSVAGPSSSPAVRAAASLC
jgi:hypothetical protein